MKKTNTRPPRPPRRPRPPRSFSLSTGTIDPAEGAQVGTRADLWRQLGSLSLNPFLSRAEYIRMAADNNDHMSHIGASSFVGNPGMGLHSSQILPTTLVQPFPSQQPPQTHMQPAGAQIQAQPQSHHNFQFQAHLAGAQNQALAQAHAQAQAQAQAQSQFRQQPQAFQFQAQAQSLAHNQIQGHGRLASSSHSLSTKGAAASAKKGQQKTPTRPLTQPGSSNVSDPYKAAEITPAARQKKKNLREKQLPDRVPAPLRESALYTQLVEFESRVDASLERKKIDIQEALKNLPSLQQTLRIYIFNTFANQNQLIPDKQPAEPPSWMLKIVGRILVDGSEPETADEIPDHNSMFPKFSSFLKRITISLDPVLYPTNHTVIWEQARSPAPQEGFEIMRKGDKEFMVNIRIEMNHTPEKFKLSPSLAEVLGIEVDTRPRILAALWHYLKTRKLHNPSEPSIFICDPALKKVFGEDTLRFSMVSDKLSQHLSPPPHIHVQHRIKLSGSSPTGNACYDVLVDVPFLLQKELAAFLANIDTHKEIDACNEAICSAIKKIEEHRRREAFFLGFSQSPVEFINALIASQSRDLKLVAGETSRNAENEHRSDFYNQPWVEDAVIRYLNRKPETGNEAPGST